MKTAREQAQAIMKEKSTKAEKREKLLKIGLTETDIQNLFFTERMVARQELKAAAADRARQQLLASYTFGVEIECCNARPNIIGIIASRHGLDFRHEAYNHNDNRSHYKLVPDSSIHGNDPIECVSPILKNGKQGFDSLKACCSTLTEAGARVNRSTGLHVHIGGNISERQYCNVFANYYHLEAVVDSFMAPSRRSGNHYCKPLHGNISESELTAATTARDICNVFGGDRYYKINATAWSRHHTIEFRQHQGSTNYDKIAAWSRFCIKLVHWSAENRLTAPVASINEIEFLTAEEKAYFSSRSQALAAL